MSDTWLKALILACVFGTVLLIVELAVRTQVSSRSQGQAINLSLKLNGEGFTRGETLRLLRRGTVPLPEWVPPFFLRLSQKLNRTLDQARLTIPTQRLMVFLLATPLVMFLVMMIFLVASGLAVGPGRVLIVAIFCGLLGCVLPLMFLQARATRTRKKIQDQFPTSLDVFVRGLRAGHPIAAALDLLTVEMPDPIGSQFGMVVDEVTYGAELREALRAMAERWDSDDMRMFVVSLSVQSETGGNLAEILENLSRVIRERQSMMLKVRALSSEGRMTAIMLTALPLLTFIVLFIFNPSFYLDVAADPWFMPGFTALMVLYLAGYFMIRRMVDLKV
jgi:tight adherence protein B